MRLASIKDVLSDLYRLGHKIRDPKLRPTSNRAVFLKAEDPETGIELFEQFAVLDKMHVEGVFRDLRQAAEDPITAQNGLSQRLATANTLRRKYFRYWEKHAQKLAQSYLEPNGPRGPQRAREADLQAASQSKSQDVAEEGQKAHPISGPTKDDGPTYLSKTDATPYDVSRDDETERASVVSFASTALDADGKGIELPGPPADALKGESFTCPYCLSCVQQGKVMARFGKRMFYTTFNLTSAPTKIASSPMNCTNRGANGKSMRILRIVGLGVATNILRPSFHLPTD